MKTRINELRKTLGLTMEKFGERLGVTKSTISSIESGRFNVTDSMSKLICIEFNVNEEWLHDGIGEMFRSLTRNDVISDFAADLLKDEEESFRRRFVEMLSNLDVDDWKALEKIAYALQKKTRIP